MNADQEPHDHRPASEDLGYWPEPATRVGKTGH
jgi:hypothetical protein